MGFVNWVGTAVCVLLIAGCAARQSPSLPAPDTSSSPGSFDAQVVQYVQVQTALAADEFDAAKAAVTDLLDIADALTSPLVRSVAAAEDIQTMRARFKPLSEYLAAKDLPQGYARAYCPMYDGGSNWVQAEGPVRNPYYGATMLTCGVVDAAPGAHMDHSPRHGGTVFMAPDSFHHIEGVYPEAGLFRLYATDNFREVVDVSTWSGRVVLEEAYDATTDEFTEVVAYDLRPSPDGGYLEAVMDDVAVPAEIIAKVIFVEEFPEERFDFIFGEYTAEAGASAAATGAAPSIESVPLAERVRPDIPEQTTDIVAEINARDEALHELISAGRFTEIFIPALQAKELGLALIERPNDLPARQFNGVRIAVRHLVRAAYLLDWYGDLGNRRQVAEAYDVFGAAASEIRRLYADAE